MNVFLDTFVRYIFCKIVLEGKFDKFFPPEIYTATGCWALCSKDARSPWVPDDGTEPLLPGCPRVCTCVLHWGRHVLLGTCPQPGLYTSQSYHTFIYSPPPILPLCSSPHFQVPNRFFLVIIQYTTHFTASFRIPPFFVSPEFSGIGRARDGCSCKCSLYYNVTTAMLAFTFLTTLDTTMSSLFVLLLCKLEVLSTLYFQCIKG